ncbi:UNVERIFIED_CONTAM: hypothetical protein K2H54_012787, partial [Gekko kuhli]
VSSIDSQEAGKSGAFPSMHRRRIVVYLPTCQPEDPGTRDASVQVGVTCEDKATQWEEREEADPSLDKPSGANTTVSSVCSQDSDGSTPRPQGQGLLKKGLLCPRERLPRDDEGGLPQEPGVSVAVLPVDRIVIYLPSCSPRRTMIPRSARKQGCQRPGWGHL